MIDNEIPKYRKKKPSSVSRSSDKSNHKHEYKEFLLIEKCKPHRAECCVICGKIANFFLFEVDDGGDHQPYRRMLTDEEIFEKHKDLKQIEIDSIWDKYADFNREMKK